MSNGITIKVAHKYDPNIFFTFDDFVDGYDHIDWDQNGIPTIARGKDITLATTEKNNEIQDDHKAWNDFFSSNGVCVDSSPNTIYEV